MTQERAAGSLPALQGLKPEFGTSKVMQAQAFMGQSDTDHQSSDSAVGWKSGMDWKEGIDRPLFILRGGLKLLWQPHIPR